MHLILDADFDIDNPQNAYVRHRGDYYAKITRFLSGGVEVLMKTVRPMASDKFGEMWAQEFPVSNIPKPKKSASEIELDRIANVRRAVKKAKQTTRGLVQQLKADRLCTLTYRENVEDREKVMEDFTRFRRLVKEGWKGQPGLRDWHYVAVLERQERGAYHIHIAVRGWQPITFLRKCWYRACGALIDSKGADTPGAVNVTPPRDNTGAARKKEWATVRLASYIVKYMQKTFDETNTEKKRYWRSKDIAPPVVYRHWLVATDMESALNELLVHLSFAEGFELRQHWSCNTGMCYWCQGVST